MLNSLIQGGLPEVQTGNYRTERLTCTWQFSLHSIISKNYFCETTKFQREKILLGIFNKWYITKKKIKWHPHQILKILMLDDNEIIRDFRDKIYIQPYMCVCVNNFIFSKPTFPIKVAQEIYYQHKRSHEIFISIFWGT